MNVQLITVAVSTSVKTHWVLIIVNVTMASPSITMEETVRKVSHKVGGYFTSLTTVMVTHHNRLFVRCGTMFKLEIPLIKHSERLISTIFRKYYLRKTVAYQQFTFTQSVQSYHVRQCPIE